MINFIVKPEFIIKSILILLFIISFSIPQYYAVIQVFLISLTILFLPFILTDSTFSFSDISFLFFLTIIFIGIYGSLIAIINGVDFNAIFINTKIYMIYPIVGLWTSILVNNYFNRDAVRLVIIYSFWFIFILNLLAVLNFYQIAAFIPDNFLKDNLLSFSIFEGRLILNSLNISSIPILCPFLIYYIFYSKTKISKRKICGFITFLLFIILNIASGRRGIWITSFLSISIMYLYFIRYKGINKFIFTSISFALFIFLAIGYSGIDSFYVDEFNDQSERSIQSDVLLRAFAESPLGNGIGSSFEVIRSEETTWVYELTWHKLLADIGIILPIIIVSIIFFVCKSLIAARRKIKKHEFDFMFTSTLALSMLLMASFTNPYILNLDGFIAMGFLLGLIDRMRKSFS